MLINQTKSLVYYHFPLFWSSSSTPLVRHYFECSFPSLRSGSFVANLLFLTFLTFPNSPIQPAGPTTHMVLFWRYSVQTKMQCGNIIYCSSNGLNPESQPLICKSVLYQGGIELHHVMSTPDLKALLHIYYVLIIRPDESAGSQGRRIFHLGSFCEIYNGRL